MKSERWRLKFLIDVEVADEEAAVECARKLFELIAPAAREVPGVLFVLPVADFQRDPFGHLREIKVGDQVEHKDSGWAGEVTAIADDDGGMGQGPLVTVKPTSPRPEEYAGGGEVGKEWDGWKPITVTAHELLVIG